MVTVEGFEFDRVDCQRDHIFTVRALVVNGNNLSRKVHLPPEEARGPGAADLRTKDTKRDLAMKFREESPCEFFVYNGAV